MSLTVRRILGSILRDIPPTVVEERHFHPSSLGPSRYLRSLYAFLLRAMWHATLCRWARVGNQVLELAYNPAHAPLQLPLASNLLAEGHSTEKDAGKKVDSGVGPVPELAARVYFSITSKVCSYLQLLLLYLLGVLQIARRDDNEN